MESREAPFGTGVDTHTHAHTPCVGGDNHNVAWKVHVHRQPEGRQKERHEKGQERFKVK